MKKKIAIAVALLIVAAIGGGLYYVFTNLDHIVEAAIEKHGSQTTQTSVRVDNVDISLANGTGAISGLSIANPKGFEAKNAFSLEAIETGINIKSVGKQPLIIDKIVIRKPQVFYEVNKDRQTNLLELQKNIAKAVGSTGKSKPSAKGEEPKLIIRRFQFADATIEANVVPLKKKYTLKLPAIEMQNLGGKNGATPSEISRQVLDTLTQRALAAVKKAGVDKKVRAVKSEVKEKAKNELEERLRR